MNVTDRIVLEKLVEMGGSAKLSELHDVLNTPNRQELVQRITRLQAIGAFNPPGARQRAGH